MKIKLNGNNSKNMDFVKRPSKKFRPDQRHGQKPRSVDGFISQNQALSPDKKNDNPAFDLSAQSATTEGFTPQNNSDATLTGAIATHATLPSYAGSLSNYAHQEPPKKHSKLKIFKAVGISLSGLAICAFLLGGFIFGKAWLSAHKIFRGGGSSSTLFNTNIKPEQLKGEGDGRVNILLVGIGGGDHDGANLTDSMVIASIDPVAKDITMLSVPRDLYVKVPDYWSMKINATYVSAYDRALENGLKDDKAQAAGFAKLEEVITSYIGVPIHYHALVNFQAFQQGVDAVGGIDINVKEDLYDDLLAGDNFNNPWIARKGQTHFDGRVGLLYAQSRHTSSDFARGERQREVLVALKEKVLATGTFSNPSRVTKLIDALGNNVTTNASLGELLRMYDVTKDIPSSSIASIGLTDEPNVLITTGQVDDQSIVLPVAGINNYDDIKTFVRSALKDPFLKSEAATVAVLNGTGEEGLAAKKAAELKSYGYNVILVDSAPTTDYSSTVIYDRSNGVKKYTRNYIEKRIGTKVASEPSGANPILVTADFVVILGSNETITKSTN
jgi:polyisoprenyl-teichoic acid--peptidoglycan teichoic acid transferase